MKLTKSKDCNPNYLAKIVEIDSFRDHPNADKLKLCTVDGYVISTSIYSKPGIYVYFPTECVINSKFLSANNLYRDPKMNSNSEQVGFFEEKGRVRCIKLRGLASEGLVMSIESLIRYATDRDESWEVKVGTEFDTVNGELFVWKYVVQTNSAKRSSGKNQKSKKQLNIVENQFRYHIDTPQLQKYMFEVNPADIIQVSSKWHGTSAIFCNLRTLVDLPWYKRAINKLFGEIYPTTHYHKFCSSRKVIKDPDLNPTLSSGYYSCDIWNLAFEVYKEYLKKGMTIYCEIVGYMPDGAMIQKDYDYGCVYDPKVYEYKTMSPKQMYDAKLFDILVYRITYTNVDGDVFEWSTQQVKEWCDKYGLHSVKELYYGYAMDLFDISIENHWHENFLEALKEKYLERDSVYCNNKVPEEGIVIRREVSDISVFKLKANRFLQKETADLDKGISNIEDDQSN